MLKHAYMLGFIRSLEESNVPGMIKEAVRLKALHGTSGKWDKLIPRFGGPLATKEFNPSGVYAATSTKREPVRKAIQTYIDRAVEARGGSPNIAKVVVDTKKGWRPSSYTEKLRGKIRQEEGMLKGEKVPDELSMEYADELINHIENQKKILKSLTGEATIGPKKKLGDLYRELNESVGTWFTPKEVKPIKWSVP